MKPYDTKIIAHRGASYDAPENTMPAIELAWKQNILKVEIDVFLTQDKQIVAIHDANTQRLTGQNFDVKHETLATLKKLDFGYQKNIKWKGTRIATLNEILNTLPSFGTLVIEIKCGVEIIPSLYNAIRQKTKNQIEFISFNYEVISSIKKEFPQFKALWLLDLDYTEETAKQCKSLDYYLEKTKAAKLDGLNLWAGKIANHTYITRIKEQGLLVYIWSTNSVEKANYFLESKVDAITTDRPYWMLEKLQQYKN